MSSVIQDLHSWGPDSQYESVSLEDSQTYCQQLATSNYENFPVVSWLLPKRLHQHFYNVYAYCRWADDLGDEVGDTERSLSLLNWWQAELEKCYNGECTHPVFIALRSTIEQFGIPQEPFTDLISAFEQDQSVTQYETFAQLKDYCTRSANPVGRIVLYLVECHTTENVAWSDSICTGLQLANFWQDVSRDLDIYRIYLPAEDRARFGYSNDDLHQRRYTPQFRELMKFEVDRARELLLTGQPLIKQMPGRIKLDIALFLQGGLEILNAIERIDYNVWKQRPVVNKTKLLLKMAIRLIPNLLRIQ